MTPQLQHYINRYAGLQRPVAVYLNGLIIVIFTHRASPLYIEYRSTPKLTLLRNHILVLDVDGNLIIECLSYNNNFNEHSF